MQDKTKRNAQTLKDRAYNNYIRAKSEKRFRELTQLITDKVYCQIPSENEQKIRGMLYDMVKEATDATHWTNVYKIQNDKMKYEKQQNFHHALFKGNYGLVSFKFSKEIMAHQILFSKAHSKAKQAAQGKKSYRIRWKINAKTLAALLIVSNHRGREILNNLVGKMKVWKKVERLQYHNITVELGYSRVSDGPYRPQIVTNYLNPKKNADLDSWYRAEIAKLKSV